MKRNKILVAIMMLALVITMLPVQEVSAATQTSLAKVQNLKAGTCTTKSINLTWSPVSGASGYQVYRANARNGKYRLLKNVSSVAFMNTTVTAGTEYFYKVRAYTYSGSKKTYGKFSGILRANTKPLSSKKVTAKYNINVRKYAGTTYQRLFGITKGTRVSVLCETQDKTGYKWYRIQVKINGKNYRGYVRSDLVS